MIGTTCKSAATFKAAYRTPPEDAEAAPVATSFVFAVVLAAPAAGVAVGEEFGVGRGEGVHVRNTWRHGLRSTVAGV